MARAFAAEYRALKAPAGGTATVIALVAGRTASPTVPALSIIVGPGVLTLSES
jgi:hypothetical protein